MDKYENALMKSIKREGPTKRTIYRKGVVAGLKRGILIGSVATIVATGLGTMGYKNLTTKRINSSYVASYEAMSDSDNIHFILNGGGKYWIYLDRVVDEYDPETMDFDSFIYGVFVKLPADVREKNMDELLNKMRVRGYTRYSSFMQYLKDRNLTKEVEGEEVIDTSKYMKEMRKYMTEYNKSKEHEEKMDEFRRGL